MSQNQNDQYQASRPSWLAIVLLAAVVVGLALLVVYSADVEAYLTARATRL